MGGLLYVASERLRWGDGHIEAGELVPNEAGRDYDGMLRLGQIAQVEAGAVGDEVAQAAIEALTVERDAHAARADAHEARVTELEEALAAAGAEIPEAPEPEGEESEDDADDDAAKSEDTDPEADAKSETPEDEKTEPPAAAGEGSEPPAADAPSYEGLKQPALKALLDERKIEYKRGPVKNEVLVALLVEADAKSE